MSVDLHSHSNASDGTDAPAELVANAAGAGVTTLALTDHDNLDGIVEAQASAEEHGIELIPGTELSVSWPQGAMHMLVYFLEPGPGPLQDRLAELQDGRNDRNRRVVIALNDLGIDISHDEVEEEAGGRGVGRPHIAAILVRKGIVPNIKAAFDEYLANGRPAYQERYRLDYVEVAKLAGASGAVPVVAHPHTIGVNEDEYRKAFEEIASVGVMGIECYYGEYSPEQRAHLASIADTLNVLATGGSDYHGSYRPEISLGSGRGDLVVPPDIAHQIAERR